MSALAQ
jgi:hypothetical protein